MNHRLAAVCSLVLPLIAATSHAADSAFPAFHFNGFGTLGVVHSSEDQADFRDSQIQPKGAGHGKDWAVSVDSRVGVQLTADFTERLTAMVQVIVEQRYDDSYVPTVEWANIKYAFTPDFSVRIGRIVLPTFISADFRKVGYVNPWVRPPIEVYGLLPLSNSDGVDASYRFHLGRLTNTVQALYGRRDFEFPDGGTFKARDITGIFSTAEFGDALLHVGYQRADGRFAPVTDFFELFRQFGPSGIAIADRFDVKDKRITQWIIGGSYNPGDWFVRAEWVRSRSRSFLGTEMAWYATGGYRIGPFTPYAGFAQRSKLNKSTDPGLDVAALPPPLQGFAAGLNAGLNSFIAANDFETFTLGARWDFMPKLSLKLQVDHIRLDDNSQGDLINIQPGFQPGGNVNVFSATFDFVF